MSDLNLDDTHNIQIQGRWCACLRTTPAAITLHTPVSGRARSESSHNRPSYVEDEYVDVIETFNGELRIILGHSHAQFGPDAFDTEHTGS